MDFSKLDGGHFIDCRGLFRNSLGLGSLMYEVPHEEGNKTSLPPSLHQDFPY